MLTIFLEPLILRVHRARKIKGSRKMAKVLCQWGAHPTGFIHDPVLRITYEIKPRIFDEKRGNATLLIKNSGFYFIFNP